MIIELSDTIPDKPGHYFGKYKDGRVRYCELIQATGDEPWWPTGYYCGLRSGCTEINKLQFEQWSEKITFRVTVE